MVGGGESCFWMAVATGNADFWVVQRRRWLVALGFVAVVVFGLAVAGAPWRRAWARRVEEALESVDAGQ